MDLKALLARAAEIRAALRKIDATTGRRTVWIADTQAEIAEFFGVSVDTVKNWAKQRMPGHAKHYPLNEIAQWLRTEGPGSSKYRDCNEDPMLAGGTSPQLERYRAAQASLAELRLSRERGELLSRDRARDVFGRWASIIRRLGERLGRKFGSEAALAVDDALDECSHSVNELDSDKNTDRGATNGTTLGAEPGKAASKPHDG